MKTMIQQKNMSQPEKSQSGKQSTLPTVLQAYKDRITQRQSVEEEELLQPKFDPSQLKSKEGEKPLQRKPNNTGLPDNLKSGIENLSGYSMDDVKVHYNSSEPATLQAHAYAQGTDIHVAPGQEKHLAHEAWHVVQQKQGRVKPTMQMKGTVPVNDDAGLEKEADVMGSKALQSQYIESQTIQAKLKNQGLTNNTFQRRLNIFQLKETEEKLITTKNFGKGYYKYEYDSSDNIKDFRDNKATNTPKGKDPVDSTTLVNLETISGTGQGEMRSGRSVDVVGASRSQHFSIADNLIDGTPSDRKSSYTWHHLTPPYYMTLVDMAVHNSFWHKGGYSLWT